MQRKTDRCRECLPERRKILSGAVLGEFWLGIELGQEIATQLALTHASGRFALVPRSVWRDEGQE
jgi:hypothetical protein